jgi:hypothetical protein
MSTPPKNSASIRSEAAGDVMGGLQPRIGFDDDVQPRRVPPFAQKLVEHHDLIGGADLGHHQRRRRCVGGEDGQHVLDPEAFAHGVDAHDPFHPVLGLGRFEKRQRAVASLGLVLGCNAVLQLHADDVGARGERLGKHVGPEARREDEGSAGARCAVCHGDTLGFRWDVCNRSGLSARRRWRNPLRRILPTGPEPMRLTRYFLPVLKENPSEAQIVSHRLMLRAGMIKQASAGIYSWLPLGFKVLQKIEQIVHEEQARAGHWRC